MTRGGVSAGGRCSSSVRSINARRDAKYSLIDCVLLLRLFFVAFEGLDARLSLRIGEDQLDLLLDLFELLIAETRQPDAFLEQLQRVVERQLFTLQTLDDLFELLKRLLELVCFQPCRHSATQSLTPSSLRQPCTPAALS